MASPNAKEGYEPGEIREKPVPKFHMAVDSEYKVCTHAVSGLQWSAALGNSR
jgi:hypothetical protein